MKGGLRYLAALLYDSLVMLSLVLLWTALLLLMRHGQAIAPHTLWYQLSLLAIGYAYYSLSYLVQGQTIGGRAWRLQMDFPSQSSKLSALHQRLVWWIPAGLFAVWYRQPPKVLLTQKQAAVLNYIRS